MWTFEDMQQLNTLTFWVQAVLVVCLSVVGLILNILAIVTLSTRKSMQNMFNYLLVSLLCADSAFLLLNITKSTLDHLILSDYLYFKLFPYLIYPMHWVTMTSSILLTVAISHERYIAIRQPIIHRQQMRSAKSRRLRLIKYILPTILSIRPRLY